MGAFQVKVLSSHHNEAQFSLVQHPVRSSQVYSDQMQWQVTVYGELTGVSFASCGLAPVPSEKFVDGTELNRNSCFSLGTGVRNSQKPTERDLWKRNVSEMISGSSLKTVVLIRKNTGRAFHRRAKHVLSCSVHFLKPEHALRCVLCSVL